MAHDTDRLQERFHHTVELDPDQQGAEVAALAAQSEAEARELERLLELDRAEGPLAREPGAPPSRHALDVGAEGTPAASPAPELEKYEILAEIGAGAFGRIYRARHRELKRHVALKVHRGLPESCRARFLAEAQALARVSHPNVVTIHDVQARGDALVLELELVEGENLHQWVQRAGPMAPREAALVALELCRALAAIHRAGLVHMDVKPANVMRASGGRVVLLDFGLTRRCESDERDVPLGGTPVFMAPECYDARAEVGPASDVYSLGVTLYWLVSGRYPYPSQLVERLRWQILEQEPRPLVDVRPDLPREFVAIVERAMRRLPAERFASMGDMEVALGRFLGAVPAARPSRRRVLLLGAGALGLASAGTWLASRAPAFSLEHEFRLTHAGEERVLDREAVIHPGDLLSLRLELSEPSYVYLFQEDGEGRRCTLFPLPAGPQNPLPAGTLELPEDNHWTLAQAGGSADHLYLLASSAPLSSAELLVQRLAAVRYEGEARTAESGGDLRGIEVVLRGDWGLAKEASDTPPANLAALFASLEDAPRRAGLYFRELELRNP